VPEADLADYRAHISRVLAGEKVKRYRTRRIGADGKALDVEISISPIQHNGDLFGFTKIIVDIQNQMLLEEQLRERLQLNKELTWEIVEVISRIIEVRDPYTEGHQRRVADLSRLMAREMGLSDNQSTGIYIAGLVHDVGKIVVPAEILVKPGQLTEIQRALIETHAQEGYEILKPVTFSWPIAEVARQHHERMDGSGYPSGLHREDIILEARIIAVADVVEAMVSHRPYRPAWSLKTALDHISKNKGLLYDADVVDICLKVIAE